MLQFLYNKGISVVLLICIIRVQIYKDVNIFVNFKLIFIYTSNIILFKYTL